MAKEASSAPLIDVEKMREDIEFTPADLDSAMIRQASLSLFYGTKLAEARQRVSNMKTTLQTAEAMVADQLRAAAVENKEKIVEARVKSEVDADARIIKFKRQLNEAQYYVDVATAAVEAFRQRRDMIVQLGVNAREERKGEVRVNDLAERDAKERVMAILNRESENRHS